MLSVEGFCDLCISDKGLTKNSLRELCKTLIDLGYQTVAINQTVDESVFEPKKKKKKGEVRDVLDIVPSPIALDFAEEFKGHLKILHRLTVSFSESLQTHKLGQSENLKKYNLLAVLPTSAQALQYACSTYNADIITFTPETRNAIRFNRKLYNQAVDRGVYFELMYGPAIQDSSSRKNIIHMAHMYHAFGKSRNVLVTSNASESIQLRGPYDVVNLCLIFGLSEEQAKTALTSTCRNLILRAGGMRHGKAVMFVKNINIAEKLDMESEDDGNSVLGDEAEDMDLDEQPALKRIKQ